MLITKKVKIRINNINIKHYSKIFNDLKLNDEIEIDIENVTLGSHVKVEVSCDKCGTIKYMSYKTYIKYINNNNNLYYCNICNLERRKKTMIKKYGVEFPMQSIDLKLKIKETNKKIYGTEWALQNNIIKNKLYETNFKKYGTKVVSQNKEVRLKQTLSKIKRIIKKYTNFLFINYDSDKHLIKFKCDKGHEFEINRFLLYDRYKYNANICTICNPIGIQFSDVENKLLNFITKNYNKTIIENSREIIKPYELDIYLPDLSLAFEFNGLYWHNELYKDKNYHTMKSDLCEEKGIQLVHIWEDDWNYKQEIVKSMILNKLGKTSNKIFARKCKIKEIDDNKLVKEFLNENHIQGFVGSNIKIGLFIKNELVSLMTFGKKRKIMNTINKDDEYELIRFCNKLNTNVVGGASKLFKYFIKNYKSKEIITYADRSHSNGNLYKKLGFKFVLKTKSNYYYVIDKKRYYRFNFRKDVLVKEGFNSNKTEHEIMLERNFYRIYNAGNLKFTF